MREVIYHLHFVDDQLVISLIRLQNSRIFCERGRPSICERKAVWSECENGGGEWGETLKNTTVRQAYIKFVQNFPFVQQREIPIGLILTPAVIKFSRLARPTRVRGSRASQARIALTALRAFQKRPKTIVLQSNH